MNPWIEKLPLVTATLAAGIVAATLWTGIKRRSTALIWWAIGVACVGNAVVLEAGTHFLGWQDSWFRWWFIFGLLLGAAPLAQGTAFAFQPAAGAKRAALALGIIATTGAVCAWRSPIDPTVVNPGILSAGILQWHWVRWFPLALNLYAVWHLGGGVVQAALQYRQATGTRGGYMGHCLIAIGGMLPGVLRSSVHSGNHAGLHLAEFAAIAAIGSGIWMIVHEPKAPPRGG